MAGSHPADPGSSPGLGTPFCLFCLFCLFGLAILFAPAYLRLTYQLSIRLSLPHCTYVSHYTQTPTHKEAFIHTRARCFWLAICSFARLVWARSVLILSLRDVLGKGVDMSRRHLGDMWCTLFVTDQFRFPVSDFLSGFRCFSWFGCEQTGWTATK